MIPSRSWHKSGLHSTGGDPDPLLPTFADIERVITSQSELKHVFGRFQRDELTDGERFRWRQAALSWLTRHAGRMSSCTASTLFAVSAILAVCIVADFPHVWPSAFLELRQVLHISADMLNVVLSVFNQLGKILDSDRSAVGSRSGMTGGLAGGMSRSISTASLASQVSVGTRGSIVGSQSNLVFMERKVAVLAELRGQASEILATWGDLLAVGNADVTAATLVVMVTYLPWIGFDSLVQSPTGTAALAVAGGGQAGKADASEESIVAALVLVHEIVKIPKDLNQKLTLLRLAAWPVLDTLSFPKAWPAGSDRCNTAQAAVAASIGNDALLCWRVFSMSGEGGDRVASNSVLLQGVALNLSLLTRPGQSLAVRRVVMTFVKNLIEEIRRTMQSSPDKPGHAAMQDLLAPVVGQTLNALYTCMQWPDGYIVEWDAAKRPGGSDEVQAMRTEASSAFVQLATACPAIIVQAVRSGISRALVDPSVPYAAFELVLLQLQLLSQCEGADRATDEMVTATVAFVHKSIGSHPAFEDLHAIVMLSYFNLAERFTALLRADGQALSCLLNVIGGSQGLQSGQATLKSRSVALLLMLSRSLDEQIIVYSPGILAAIESLLKVAWSSPYSAHLQDMSVSLYTVAGLLIGNRFGSAADRVGLLQAAGGSLVERLYRVLPQIEAGALLPDSPDTDTRATVLDWLHRSLGGLTALADGYSQCIQVSTPADGGAAGGLAKSASDSALGQSMRLKRSKVFELRTLTVASKMSVTDLRSMQRQHAKAPRSRPPVADDQCLAWGGSPWFASAATTACAALNACVATGSPVPIGIRSGMLSFLYVLLRCCGSDLMGLLDLCLPQLVSLADTEDAVSLCRLVSQCIVRGQLAFLPAMRGCFVPLTVRVNDLLKRATLDSSLHEEDGLATRPGYGLATVAMKLRREFFRVLKALASPKLVSRVMLTEANLHALPGVLDSLHAGCLHVTDPETMRLAFQTMRYLIMAWLSTPPLQPDHLTEEMRRQFTAFAAGPVTRACFAAALHPEVEEVEKTAVRQMSGLLYDLKIRLGASFLEVLSSSCLPAVSELDVETKQELLRRLHSQGPEEFDAFFDAVVTTRKTDMMRDLPSEEDDLASDREEEEGEAL